MPALCLHEAIRPSFLHPSSLFPSSQLACFAPGGMLLCVNSSLHGFGRSEFSWDVQSLQVLCECFPAGPLAPIGLGVHSPAHTMLQGRRWDGTLVHTVILAGFLLVLVDLFFFLWAGWFRNGNRVILMSKPGQGNLNQQHRLEINSFNGVGVCASECWETGCALGATAGPLSLD